jgi:hypothetical protein
MRFQLTNGWVAKIVQPNPILEHLLKFADEGDREAILELFLPPVTNPEKVLILNWEIFSEKEYLARKKLEEEKTKSQRKQPVRSSRTFDFIESLRPTQYAVGMTFDRRRRYVVAMFPHVVIAESTAYGNAIYIALRDGWEDNLSRSKAYCLRQGGRRVVHSEGWERRLREAIASLLT